MVHELYEAVGEAWGCSCYVSCLEILSLCTVWPEKTLVDCVLWPDENENQDAACFSLEYVQKALVCVTWPF